MKLVDILIIAVILLILGGAAFFIIRAKKQGKKCIGCPHSCNCQGGCGNSK